ncbi:MAG TPA: hypothetical protein VMI54_00350 [Polyangiaceae bacterium]|nr:hypothetical protein [Polyangiaceae bacterium]
MSDSQEPHDDAAPPEADDEARADRPEDPVEPARRPKKRPKRASNRVEAKPAPSRGGLVAVIALAAASVGAAGGWFGHDAQTKAKLVADSPAAAGSGGPCAAWQQKICAGNGEESAACQEAKDALDLLTPPTCAVALEAVPATLAKVKAARAPCDTLVKKLCADLPPGAQTCTMVRERTPSFPVEKCTGMLEHYDDVITQLKQMEEQQALHMNGTPGGHAPSASGTPAPPAAP